MNATASPYTRPAPQTLAESEIDRLAVIHAADLAKQGIEELSEAQLVEVARACIVWELQRGIFNAARPESPSFRAWERALRRTREVKAEEHRELIAAVYVRACADLEAAGLDFHYLAEHHKRQIEA